MFKKDIINVKSSFSPHPAEDIPAADQANLVQNEAGTARRSSQKALLRLTVSGVFAALIFVATFVIKIPTTIGYANMGDGVILFASYLLGPLAFFPAAIGSALADLLAGYPVYIPATFVIKGLMGLVAGFIMKRTDVSLPRKIFAFVIAEGIMVSGYFLFETALYHLVYSLTSIIPNLIQGGVGIAIAIVLCTFLARMRTSVRTKLQESSEDIRSNE